MVCEFLVGDVYLERPVLSRNGKTAWSDPF